MEFFCVVVRFWLWWWWREVCGLFLFRGFFPAFLPLSLMVILDMGTSPMMLACVDFGFSIGLWLDFRLFLFLSWALFRSGYVSWDLVSSSKLFGIVISFSPVYRELRGVLVIYFWSLVCISLLIRDRKSVSWFKSLDLLWCLLTHIRGKVVVESE